MNIRVEDDGSIFVAVRAEENYGNYHHSECVAELVSLDFDQNNKLIGVEIQRPTEAT